MPRTAASPQPGSEQSGHTLVELLVVLAILALFTGWLVQGRPSRVPAAATALRTQIHQARYQAIERNSPVALVYRSEEAAFVTLAAPGATIPGVCAAGSELSRLNLSAYPGVRVKTVAAGGLVWLPSGTGRTCAGGGAFNQTIELIDSRRSARVIVSRAGRVRSEVDL